MNEIKQESMGQEGKSSTLMAAERCDEGMQLYRLKQYKEVAATIILFWKTYR